MRVTYLVSYLALALGSFAITERVSAAPVWLQTYEGGLVEPFHLQPDQSGSTRGIADQAAPNNPGTSTIVLNTADGALGTAQSAALNIVDNANAGSPTGTAYSIRFVPNNAAGTSAANPTFSSDGYVGFYLKLDPIYATALLEVAPVLETGGASTTAAGGVLRSVIADGQWHRYQWNMDDPATDFTNSFNSFYGSTPATQPLGATVSIDSIAIISRGVNGASSAVLHIDQIGYDNAGTLPPSPVIPEPTTLFLAGFGLIGLLAARRRA